MGKRMDMVSFKQNNKLYSNLNLRFLECNVGSLSAIRHCTYNVFKRIFAPKIGLNRVQVLRRLPHNSV